MRIWSSCAGAATLGMALRGATSCGRVASQLSKARSHSCIPTAAGDLTRREHLAVIQPASRGAWKADKNVGRLGTAYRFEESAQRTTTSATAASTASRGVRATANE